MIKSIRNNLHNTGFRVGLKEATWKVIVDFFTLDQQSQTGLRMAPKLSKDHIQLKPFSKMRVSLATQVLSNSVSKGIKSAIKTCQRLIQSKLWFREEIRTKDNEYGIKGEPRARMMYSAVSGTDIKETGM